MLPPSLLPFPLTPPIPSSAAARCRAPLTLLTRLHSAPTLFAPAAAAPPTCDSPPIPGRPAAGCACTSASWPARSPPGAHAPRRAPPVSQHAAQRAPRRPPPAVCNQPPSQKNVCVIAAGGSQLLQGAAAGEVCDGEPLQEAKAFGRPRAERRCTMPEGRACLSGCISPSQGGRGRGRVLHRAASCKKMHTVEPPSPQLLSSMALPPPLSSVSRVVQPITVRCVWVARLQRQCLWRRQQAHEAGRAAASSQGRACHNAGGGEEGKPVGTKGTIAYQSALLNAVW